MFNNSSIIDVVFDEKSKEKQMGVHCVDGLFVAVLSRGDTVLACSVPTDDENAAKKSFANFRADARAKASTSNVAFETRVAAVLVGLLTDPIAFWKRSQDIKIDTDHPVLLALRKTEPGASLSYRRLAELSLQNAKAARAVGTAMRTNPFPLLVPCHRVVKADGSLGNYSGAGGVRTKETLLKRERGEEEEEEQQQPALLAKKLRLQQ
jgi:O-6-methylguanine DNA methyltransferase